LKEIKVLKFDQSQETMFLSREYHTEFEISRRQQKRELITSSVS